MQNSGRTLKQRENIQGKRIKILLNNGVCILLSVIVLMFVLTVSAQDQTEKEIAKIRAEVAAINKGVSKYAKTTKNVEDVSLCCGRKPYLRQWGI